MTGSGPGATVFSVGNSLRSYRKSLESVGRAKRTLLSLPGVESEVNTCENRHSFLRQWLAKFRGVSKHHLQKYLNFLALKLNSPN